MFRITRHIISKIRLYFSIFISQTRIQISILKLRAKKEKKIRVAFLVVYDMVFQFEHVFQLMLEDEMFDPYIVIIPDTLRGKENMLLSLESSYKTLSIKYPGKILSSIGKNGNFTDIKAKYDIFFLMNPYSGMTHKFYTIRYLSEKGKLCAYANYAVGEGTKNSKSFDTYHDMSFLWRFYLERPSEEMRIKKFHPTLSFLNRAKVVGATKSDIFSIIKRAPRNRPRIIIAPHHSVPGNNTPLSMGNFDLYANFFLELPKLYPNIDWIFRPHPLLFWTMINLGYWTEETKLKYIKKLKSFSNVQIQTSGDYYEAFVNSDALIQDSGSFLAEYHITKHPQCYILRNEQSEFNQFNAFGREMLSHTYKAYSKDHIHSFIQNVVLSACDTKKDERIKFATKNLMYNFPYASKSIIDDIKHSLEGLI